ncbi:unnamed protein product [Lathyrus oleraceus]
MRAELMGEGNVMVLFKLRCLHSSREPFLHSYVRRRHTESALMKIFRDDSKIPPEDVSADDVDDNVSIFRNRTKQKLQDKNLSNYHSRTLHSEYPRCCCPESQPRSLTNASGKWYCYSVISTIKPAKSNQS